MANKEQKPVPREHSGKSESELVLRFKANPPVFIGTVLVLIIVVIAFVLVPAIVPEAAGSREELSFGSYNKKPIKYVPGNYFAQAYASAARSYQARNGGMDAMSSFEVWREAFTEAVVHAGVLDEMRNAGYTAPAEVVDREVALLPQFQENGRFSPSLYRSLDNTSRLSLWREVQDSIADNYFRSDITGLRVPAGETEFVGKMASPMRRFDLVSFPVDDYPQEEIRAYGEANAKKFRVTHLSRITINSSEKEARDILDSVQNGTSSFEDAAKTYSQDGYADKGGDMGVKLAWELDPEAAEEADREQIINLQRGTFSDLLKVSSGWAFFRAEEAPHPADMTDSSMIEKVKSYITTFERGRMEDWAISQADAFIAAAKADGFDGAAAERDLEKKTFGPLPLNYGDLGLFNTLSSFRESVPEIARAETNVNFWKTCFSTELLSPSAPMVVGSNVLVVIPLEETDADETNVGYITSAYGSYWMSSILTQNIRNFFMGSPRLENNFDTTFIRYFWPQQ